MIKFNGTGYTEAEIITMYMQAKNRHMQIKIIADLLLTTPSEVRNYLAGKGLIETPVCTQKKKKATKAWPPAKVKRLTQAYQTGESKKQVALELGMTMHALYAKAHDLGITSTVDRTYSKNTAAV